MKQFLSSLWVIAAVALSSGTLLLSGCGSPGEEVAPQEMNQEFGSAIKQSGARAQMEEERKAEEAALNGQAAQ